jgi:nitrogen fixation/metabolism regulation signal transduction histidine kinase
MTALGKASGVGEAGSVIDEASSALLLQILDGLPLGAIVFDRHLSIQAANGEAARLLKIELPSLLPDFQLRARSKL